MNVIDNLRLLAKSQPDAAELLLANPAVPAEHVKELLSTATLDDSGLLIALAANPALSFVRFHQLVDRAEDLSAGDSSPSDEEESLVLVILCEAISNPALPADLLARGGRALTKTRVHWAGDVVSHPNLPREVYVAMVDAVLAGHFPEDRALLETFFSKEVLDHYGAYRGREWSLLRWIADSPHFISLDPSTQAEVLAPRPIQAQAGDTSKHIVLLPNIASAESLRILYGRLRGNLDPAVQNFLASVVGHRNFPADCVNLPSLRIAEHDGALFCNPDDLGILVNLPATDRDVADLLQLVVRSAAPDQFHPVSVAILESSQARDAALLSIMVDRIEDHAAMLSGRDLDLIRRIVRNPGITADLMDRIASILPDEELDGWTVRFMLLNPVMSRSTRLSLLARLSHGEDDEVDAREDFVHYITSGTIPLKEDVAWGIYRMERVRLNAVFHKDHRPGPGVHNAASEAWARNWLHKVLEQRDELVVDGVMQSTDIEDLLIDLIYDLLVPGHGTEADWLNLALMFGVVGSTARRADGSKNS